LKKIKNIKYIKRRGRKMEKIKVIGSDKCEACKKVKEAIEKMKKQNVEYVEITPENVKELKNLLPKEELKKEEELKLPFAVDEKGNYCEIHMTDDVILAICKDKIKVLYDKETDEIIEALKFFFK